MALGGGWREGEQQKTAATPARMPCPLVPAHPLRSNQASHASSQGLHASHRGSKLMHTHLDVGWDFGTQASSDTAAGEPQTDHFCLLMAEQ